MFSFGICMFFCHHYHQNYHNFYHIIVIIIIIINGTFFRHTRKTLFDVRKKDDQVARIEGGGGMWLAKNLL